MTKPRRRILVLQVFFGCLLTLFIGRLWQLQISRGPEFVQEAAANRTQTVRTEAPRGLIFDRNGKILAENRRTWLLGVDPTKFPKKKKAANRCILRLSSLLGDDATKVRRAVKQALASSIAQQVPLPGMDDPIDLATVAKVQEAHYDLPGIVVLERSERYYPRGSLAAHVLGYARPITARQYEADRDITVPPTPGEDDVASLVPDKLYGPQSISGQTGIEAACDLDRSGKEPIPLLMGLPGRTVLDVDVRGQPVRVIAGRDPKPGASVYLTLDVPAQKAAESALEDEIAQGHGIAGAVVAVNVNNGQVLVMCSKPGFDPNAWVSGLSPAQWRRITNDPRTPLMNRAIGGAYPPGSTFKIISSVAAFQSIGLKTTTTFTCTGSITVGWKHTRYRCWKPGGHGVVDYWRAVAESCDVYFYNLVWKLHLSPDAIAYWAREFGLGRPTGICLPGEAEGLVPDPTWRRLVLRESWRLGDSLNMVIGQGYVAATPLQMAMATAAIANGGKLYKPELVRKVVWPAWMHRLPTLTPPDLVHRVPAAPATFDKVRRAMRLAVTSKHGTAQVVGNMAVTVAAKTGSAQQRPGRPTHAWFVCFAPYEHPKYAISVFVDSGGHGGSTAGPIARKVLTALFRLKATEGGPAGPSD